MSPFAVQYNRKYIVDSPLNPVAGYRTVLIGSPEILALQDICIH